MLFFGLDGDSIGRIIESLLIQNDTEAIKKFSGKVVAALDEIQKLAEEQKAEVLFCTGDSILIYGDMDESFGQEILKVFHKQTERTASVGIGTSTAFTYLGLKLAKSRGGGQVVFYEKELRKKE